MTDIFGQEIIKALTWRQPFASLMLHGKIETRTWDTAYRGTVLICAGLTPYSQSELFELSGVELMLVINNVLEKEPTANSVGYAIATGELIHTRKMRKHDEDKCFVRYSPDLYCHMYANIQRIIPYEYKGKLGWKTLSITELSKVKNELL